MLEEFEIRSWITCNVTDLYCLCSEHPQELSIELEQLKIEFYSFSSNIHFGGLVVAALDL